MEDPSVKGRPNQHGDHLQGVWLAIWIYFVDVFLTCF